MDRFILRLAVKKEYFEQIREGSKKEEYREIKPYWDKRLAKHYDEVWITLGYPSTNDEDRIQKFKYDGYIIKCIRHKEFGNDKETEVYAIQLKTRI